MEQQDWRQGNHSQRWPRIAIRSFVPIMIFSIPYTMLSNLPVPCALLHFFFSGRGILSVHNKQGDPFQASASCVESGSIFVTLTHHILGIYTHRLPRFLDLGTVCSRLLLLSFLLSFSCYFLEAPFLLGYPSTQVRHSVYLSLAFQGFTPSIST